MKILLLKYLNQEINSIFYKKEYFSPEFSKKATTMCLIFMCLKCLVLVETLTATISPTARLLMVIHNRQLPAQEQLPDVTL